MAGFELGYNSQKWFTERKIHSLHVITKGRGTQLKGFLTGLTRHRLLRISRIENKTPVAHNGTKGFRKRRL